jgi:aspartate kinase
MRRRLIVQKYGGTSVATVEKIRAVARKVVETKRQGSELVVVLSAMGRTTDQLLDLARQVAEDPHRRELDVLLSTGELTSISLLAMAIRDLGEEAISLTGGQCGIITNDVHTNARILRIHAFRLRQEIAREAIVVVAGFQGVGPDGEITTLGRGGSDTSATALAAALNADACQIFTDVDCVYSADPRLVPAAQPLPELCCEEVQEMAWHGAQVMKAEAVEFAKSNGVSFEIASTFGGAPGSHVRSDAEQDVFVPRRPEVAGVTGRTDLQRFSFARSAMSAVDRRNFFQQISGYDLVFGRLEHASGTLHLLLSTLEIPNPDQLFRDLDQRFSGRVSVAGDLGAVSLVGFGLGSRPAAFFDALGVLEDAGFEVLESFSGRESLTFVIEASRVQEGIRVLHRSFVEGKPCPASLSAQFLERSCF